MTCFSSTMTYSTVMVTPLSVWLWPIYWMKSLSTAALRLGEKATAAASSLSTGTLPQARAKGVDRFTRSTKAANTAATLPAGALIRRHSLRRRALARARATAPSRAGGSSSGASRRALYSSMRSMAQTSSVRCSFNRDRALRWRVDTVPGGMSRAWAVSARVRPWK